MIPVDLVRWNDQGLGVSSLMPPKVKIIGTFPEDSHPPIIYPIALTASASHPDATAFLAYIRSAKAKPVFEAQGFTVLSRGQS